MNFTNITLFNHYAVGHDLLYQRTYLYKVDWGAPAKNIGSPASYSTQIVIPFEQTLYFRPVRAWLLDKTNHWTLQLEDVIVKGIVDAQIDTVTDLYGNYSLTDLRKKYELVTIVTTSLNNASISQQAFTIGAS